MDNHLGNQDRFLLLGSRITLNDIEFNDFNQLIKKVDNWPLVYKKAITLNIASLLYKNCVKSKNRDVIPSNVLTDLKRMYIKTLIQNTKMNADFKELMLLLSNNHIDFIPLKGIWLNFEVYKDLGLRLMSDIDLLIKENDIESTKNIMLENGWSSVEKTYRSKTHQEIDKLISHDFYSLKKEHTLIELHNGIHRKNKPYNVNIIDYWNRSTNQEFMGINTLILNKTDILMHLCLHTHGDFIANTIKLKLFVDITEFLKNFTTEIDWDQLKRMCIIYNCLNEVQIILKLCKKFFKSDINSSFIDNSIILKQNGIDYEKLFLNVFEKNTFSSLFYFVSVNYRKATKIKELTTFKSLANFAKGYLPFSEKYQFEINKKKSN